MRDECESLRRMVGLSATWQAATGLTGQDAIDRVGLSRLPGKEPRPIAVVAPMADYAWKLVAEGDQLQLLPAGTLQLFLAIDHPEGRDELQGRLETLAFAAGIIQDVALLSGADDPGESHGHLAIHEIGMMGGWRESGQEHWRTLGRFWSGSVYVAWKA